MPSAVDTSSARPKRKRRSNKRTLDVVSDSSDSSDTDSPSSTKIASISKSTSRPDESAPSAPLEAPLTRLPVKSKKNGDTTSAKRKRDKDVSATTPIKRVKKDKSKTVEAPTSALPVAVEALEQDLPDRSTAKKAKKIKSAKTKNQSGSNAPKEESKPVQEAEEGGGASDPEDDPKYKALLSKREKSLKKAEKLARKLAKTATSEDVPLAEEEAELHALEPLPQPEPILESDGKPTFSALPDWLASPIRVSPSSTASFSDLGLQPEAIKVLQNKGFKNAFAVQAAVLPLLLSKDRRERGDLLVSAATGSGKTLSYVLPMISDISQTTVPRIRGLIVMPTRELVNQAREVCEVCANAFSVADGRRVNIGIALGNHNFKTEQASLIGRRFRYDPENYVEGADLEVNEWGILSRIVDDGNPFHRFKEGEFAPSSVEHFSKVDVLICTPGRLVEHIKGTPGFTLDYLKWLVIDEADKLFDQSFQQWLETVMESLIAHPRPRPGVRDRRAEDPVRKVVLSATVTRDLGQLSALKLNRPKLVVLEGSQQNEHEDGDVVAVEASYVLPETLRESVIKVEDANDKPLYLLHLLKHIGIYDSTVGKAELDSDSDSSSASDSDRSSDTSSDADSDSDSSSDDSSSDSDSDSEASTSSSDSSPTTSSIHSSPVATTAKPSTSQKVTTEQSSNLPPHGILIFTRSNESTLRLARLLTLLLPTHPQIGILTSSVRASSRRRTLQSFAKRTISILVASDLVARGLDIPALAHVVNYDVPTSVRSYVHRVGRTARAGREGKAWTLVDGREARWVWNEVFRSAEVGRREGRKVERVDGWVKVIGGKGESEEMKTLRQRYETALEEVGREARGEK